MKGIIIWRLSIKIVLESHIKQYAGLHSSVVELMCVHDVVPLFFVEDVVEAWTAHLLNPGNANCLFPLMLPIKVLFHAHLRSTFLSVLPWLLPGSISYGNV